ncbi:MAG: DUF6273 domain-containing protein [Clostridiales bacterium]|nr:DUF6273 domain-containing protein [Clostridiales bacterium]
MNDIQNRKRLAAMIMASSFLLSSCSGGHSADYSRARSLFSEGKYDEARQIFSNLADYENSTKYIAYIDAWNAGKNGDYNTAYNGFQSLAGFLDSAEEAADFSKQAQKDAYASALQHFRHGEYDEAIKALSQLSGYEDADLYLEYAGAMLSAREGEYSTAIDTFASLGDFRDSSFQAEKWTLKQKETAYENAIKVLNEGKYTEAAAAFESMISYEDSERYLDYAHAQISLSNGEYAEAITAFTNLGAFLDSPAMVVLAENSKAAKNLESAQSAIQAGNYQDAIQMLQNEQTGSLDGSGELLRYAEALNAAQNGSYDETLAALSVLNSYAGSHETDDGEQKDTWDALYQEAVSLFNQGEIEKAGAIFLHTDPYEHSHEYLSYISALKNEAAGQYGKAAEELRSIPEFLDSDDKANTDWALYCKDAYSKAKTLFENGSFDEAGTIFDSIKGYESSSTYLDYIHAEMLGRSGAFSDAEAGFVALGEFSDSAKRAEVYTILKHQQTYDHAVSLYESGQLEEAAACFAEADHYGDSDLYIRYLQAKNQLQNGDKENAFTTMKALGAFLDSEDLAASVEQEVKAAVYQSAVSLYESGNLADAENRFTQAVPYHDAQKYVDYINARKLEESNRLSDAAEQYHLLAGFLDSNDREAALLLTLQKQTFERACDLTILGRLDDARGLFESIDAFEGVQEYLKYIEARNTEDSDPDSALSVYTALGAFLDSAERASALEERTRQDAYQTALRYITLDQLEDAKAAFETLSGYRDSADYVQYLSARLYEEQGEKGKAEALYSSLTKSFLDSAKRAEALDADAVAGIYAQAVLAVDENRLDDAKALFDNIYPYENTESYLILIQAAKYEADGKYRTAADLFDGLGDFENSSSRAKHCLDALHLSELQRADTLLENGSYLEALAVLSSYQDESSLQMSNYCKALQLMENGQYNDAIVLFNALGTFRDSKSYAEDCSNAIRDIEYQNALVLFHTEKYAEAKNVFLALGNYSDSAKYLSYIEADACRRAKDYDGAISIFQSLGTFEDSEEQIKQTANNQTAEVYQSGIEALKDSRLEDAYSLFMLIPDYSESKKYLDYLKARNAELDGNYTSAAEIYASLQSGILDSADRSADCAKKSQDGLLRSASDLMDQGNWQSALDILDTLSVNVRDETAYCQAGLLMEQGKYDEARDAFRALIPLRSSASYAEACQTALSNEAYSEGVSALGEGRLADARTCFEKAGTDYLDTETYLNYLSAREAEEAGSFQVAETLYESAADFLDSRERKELSHTAYLREQYLEAAVLLGQGRLKAARDIYETLDHYLQTDEYLSYIEGRRLENDEETLAAAKTFAELGSFLDADIRAEHNFEKSNAASYAKALRYYQLGLLENSRDTFSSVGSYKDAETYAAYLTEVLNYTDGNHLEKAARFAAFGDFEHAQEYAAYLQALSLEEEGQYEEAAAIFLAHASFLDSSEHYLSMPLKIMDHDLKVASEYLAEGKDDEAENVYQTMLTYWKTEGNTVEVKLAEQADAALELGDEKTARTLYTLLVRHGDLHAQAKIVQWAQGLYDAGKANEALDILTCISQENETADTLRDACHLQLAQEAEKNHNIQLAYNEYAQMRVPSEKTKQFEQAYVDAMNLLIDGDYLKAKEAFEALNNLLDSGERAQEAAYRAAGAFEEQGKADEASSLFKELGDYRDSASRINEPYHILAMQLLDKEAWEDAAAAFEKAGESETGKQLIQKTQYEKAQAFVQAGDYEQASKLYSLAGDYLDSSERVQATHLERGDALLASGDYASAVEAYENAYPTEEAWKRIQMAHYAWAEALTQSGDRRGASDHFALAGNYLDAQNRIREPFDQYGDSLAAEGAYVSAADAYLEAGSNEATYEKILSLLTRLQDSHLYDDALLVAERMGEKSDAYKADVMLHKAEYLLSQKDWKAASEAFEASSMPERTDEPYELQAADLIADGEYDAAITVYDALGDTQKANNLIHETKILHAESLLKNGHYDEAFLVYSDAGELDKAFGVYFLEGDALLEKGMYDAAVDAYAKAGDTKESTEKMLKARYMQGTKLLEEQSYDQAATAFSEAEGYEDASEKKKEAYQLAAAQMLQQETYDAAAAFYSLLGDTQMEKAAYYAYGQKCLDEGKWDEASSAFIHAGDYEDAHARITESYITAGNQLLSQDKFDEALEMFAKAGADGAEKVQAVHYQHAVRLMAEGQPALASSEFIAAGNYLDAASRISEPFNTEGEVFLKEGKYPEAISAFAKAGADGEANLIKAHYLYAENCEKRSDWYEAEKQYIAAGTYENAQEHLHDMYLKAGKALATEGKYEEAISMYMKSGLDSEETIQELHYQEAENALAHGLWDKAHDLFAAAGNYRDALERIYEPYLTAGSELLAQGKYDEAISAYSKAGALGEQEVLNVHYVHAEKALVAENWEEAVQEFTAAGNYKDAMNRIAEPYLTAGDLLLADGAYDDAISMFAHAGENGKERISLAHMLHAEALQAEQKWDEANREFALAGEQSDSPSRVNEPYLTAGDHLLAGGAYEEAIAMYAKAGEAGRTSIQKTYYQQAVELMNAQSWEKANAAFIAAGDYSDAALRINEPYFTAGDLLLAAQQWDEAVVWYAKAGVAGSERIKLAYYAEAEALLKEQNWTKASAAFREAGDVKDAAARVNEPYLTAGNILLATQNYDEAIAMYAKAGNAGIEDVQKAYYAKAESLLDKQAWEEASAAFKAAGSYRDASERINEPFLIAGNRFLESQQFAEAIEMYARAGDEGIEKTQSVYYAKAETLLWALSWEESSAAFRSAGEYKDAPQRINEPFVTAGNIYLASKAWDEAIAMYAKAGAEGAELIQKTHYLHAEALLDAHSWQQSSAEFAAAGTYQDAKSRVPQPFIQAGHIALNGGDYTEAIEMYAKAQDAGTSYLKAAYYAYAESLIAKGSWDEASHAFELAGDYLNAKERQTEPYRIAAEKASESKDYALASSYYLKAGNEQAAQRSMYVLAETLLAQQDWDGASNAFKACGKYQDAESRVSEPYIVAGDAFLSESRYSEAIRMYSKAGDAGSVSIQKVYYTEAEALLTEQKWDEASRLFLQAGEYRDAQNRAYTAFKEEGDQLLSVGKSAEAFAAYSKAGEIGTTWIHAVHYQWAQDALAAGDWKASSQEFILAEDYMDAQTRIYEPYYVQGKQLMEKNDYIAAADAFTQAKDYSNAQVCAKEAWYNYAQEMLDLQDYTKANTYFGMASGYLNADDMADESIYLLGCAYLEQNDFENAYDAFRTIRGYRDADEMLQTWRLRQVSQGRTGKRSKYTVGRCIGLGKFMQSAGCDQSETVEWMIICRDDNRVLLTTRYIMTGSNFSGDASSDYMNSKVREFLNGTFLTECFEGKLLQSLIPQTELNGDRVFALSKDECDQYLLNGKWQYKNRAAAKSWARGQGVAVRGEHHVGSYWLRNETSSNTKALAVLQDGTYGLVKASDPTVGIRPAIWIDLNVLYPE